MFRPEGYIEINPCESTSPTYMSIVTFLYVQGSVWGFRVCLGFRGLISHAFLYGVKKMLLGFFLALRAFFP